jgi:drug/metabolite transporter (DMT)-like permease
MPVGGPETKPSSLAERLYAKPYLMLILAALGWGGNAVAARMALGQISPMMLTASRWGLVLAIMLATCREPIRAGWPEVRRRWRAVLLMGGAGLTAFNALNYVAAHHTSAVNLSIIQGAIPLLVLLGGLAVHRTPIRPGQMLGVAVALAGVAMVASHGRLETLAKLQFNVGDLMMLGACGLYAGYTVALRGLGAASGGAGALGFFFGMACAAFVTSLPLLAAEVAAGGFLAPSAKGWGIMIYIALAPSFVCQIFFMRAVALIGPSRAGLFINLVPVFGALLAVVVLGEPFGPYQALALGLVLSGIAVSEFAVRPSARHLA